MNDKPKREPDPERYCLEPVDGKPCGQPLPCPIHFRSSRPVLDTPTQDGAR